MVSILWCYKTDNQFNFCSALSYFQFIYFKWFISRQTKIAKVIPFFKNGNTSDMTNYRPISVLPLFSKIFEKCLYKRLYKFLSSCNILFGNQYGFRSGHSASMALLDFIDKVPHSIDSKHYIIHSQLLLLKLHISCWESVLLHCPTREQAKYCGGGLRGHFKGPWRGGGRGSVSPDALEYEAF